MGEPMYQIFSSNVRYSCRWRFSENTKYYLVNDISCLWRRIESALLLTQQTHWALDHFGRLVIMLLCHFLCWVKEESKFKTFKLHQIFTDWHFKLSRVIQWWRTFMARWKPRNFGSNLTKNIKEKGVVCNTYQIWAINIRTNNF